MSAVASCWGTTASRVSGCRQVVTSSHRPDTHTDVSLWFVLAHDRHDPLEPDEREYAGVRWWTPAEIRAADPGLFDPHMGRMLDKLKTLGA
ncbi:hypothetical protein [Nocardioides sp. NPDC006273]|uniref:hypothetical protein n=1 Tax=Nocardioides sp. NPDC006273 TaxID=3155598 RepID=UPI0033ABC3B8